MDPKPSFNGFNLVKEQFKSSYRCLLGLDRHDDLARSVEGVICKIPQRRRTVDQNPVILTI